ncbi:hypothetical protein KI387_018386, partial [Taxus chinensis]
VFPSLCNFVSIVVTIINGMSIVLAWPCKEVTAIHGDYIALPRTAEGYYSRSDITAFIDISWLAMLHPSKIAGSGCVCNDNL